MKKLFSFSFIMLIVNMATFSQEAMTMIENDSIQASNDSISKILYHDITPSKASTLKPTYLSVAHPNLDAPYKVPTTLFDGPIMPSLGGFTGYSKMLSLPGLMGVEGVSLGYNFTVGNLTFTPNVGAYKYGYFGGLTTSYGVGGTLTYRLNNAIRITTFGQFYTQQNAYNLAVTSNMRASRYGGYGTWNINDKWGVNVGVQRVYDSVMYRWNTVPILMPTFKINGKDAIGIDLGGILYEIVQMRQSSNWNKHSNPTTPPTPHKQAPRPPRK